MIYADASFIVALFVREDEHWQRAWQWWRAEQGPILTVTRLGVFEAENTVRALVVAREIRPWKVGWLWRASAERGWKAS